MTSATSGYGCILKIGDGGVGAGTQASKTIGTVNQQLRVKARYAGVAGNSKTFGIVVSGNNTPYSQTITSSSVLINSATNGGGTATTTVLQAISLLSLSTTFVDYFQADVNSGDGSGVLVAGASGALSGGTDGTEVFTTIAEVKGVRGPSLASSLTEVTNFDSTNSAREFIATLVDSGTLNFNVNYLPAGASHTSIVTDMRNRTRRNFKLQFSDSAPTTMSFAGIITGFEIGAELEQALNASVTIKVTSWPTWA